MPAHRYVEEVSSVAMLAAKRSAGVAPELNLMEHVKHTPPVSVIKAAHFGFKTQMSMKGLYLQSKETFVWDSLAF